jgi:hypothetical protein
MGTTRDRARGCPAADPRSRRPVARPAAAGPGSFVFLPRDLPHTFRSVGAAATGLSIVTPGGLDQYFTELHAALSTTGDRSEIAKVQAKYGIVQS